MDRIYITGFLFIPYLYIYNGVVIYKRVYKTNDDIIFKTTIFYKLDTLTYYIIDRIFDNNFNLTDINKVLKTVIDQLDKKYK